MLGGLDTPTAGAVWVDGQNLARMDGQQLALFRRRKVGFVFQQYNLIPDCSVYENVIFPLELDGAAVDREWVGQILQALGLTDKREMFPAMLSGGEQQRAAIARALVTRPAICWPMSPRAIWTQRPATTSSVCCAPWPGAISRR